MKKLLGCFFFSLPFLVLLLLISLTFFLHPTLDDLTGCYFVKGLGFTGAVRQYFVSGTGRYISATLFLLVTSGRAFLHNYYFVIPAVFIILTYWNIWFFIKWINSSFFDFRLSNLYRHWIAAFVLLVFVSVVPEPGSFIFWVTTDVVYLLSFNFFLYFLRALFAFLTSTTLKSKMWNTAKIILITVIIAGCDEVTIYFSSATVALVIFYCVITLRRMSGRLWLLTAIQLLMVCMVFLLPGNQVRSDGFANKQPAVYSLIGALYQSAEVFFYMFSDIFFWLTVTALIFLSSFLKPGIQHKLRLKKTSLLFELLILFAAVVFLHFVVRQWGGRVIPPRTHNLVACYSVLGFLLVTLANSHLFSAAVHVLQEQLSNMKNLVITFLLFLLIFNPFMKDLLQSLITAPVHNIVLNQRVKAIEAVKMNGGEKVIFESYKRHYERVLQAKFVPKIASFLKAEFPPPPAFFLFGDDPASEWSAHAYAEFYDIDTIAFGNNVFVRWSLTDKGYCLNCE